MALLLALLGAVLMLVAASGLLLRWNEVRYSRRRGLPPGTMGWPLFGETTEFLKQGPSFMKARRLRLVSFGLLGKPMPLHCSVFFKGEAEEPLLCLRALFSFFGLLESSSIIEKERKLSFPDPLLGEKAILRKRKEHSPKAHTLHCSSWGDPALPLLLLLLLQQRHPALSFSTPKLKHTVFYLKNKIYAMPTP
jgi:hypothetical protein